MRWLMILALLFALLSSSRAEFPARIPTEKPDYPVSAAVARLYDQWNPHEDRGNELYCVVEIHALRAWSEFNGYAS